MADTPMVALFGALALAAMLSAGCGNEDLSSEHPGWAHAVCSECHPRKGHQDKDPWACAKCHGANGACDPLANAGHPGKEASCQDCHSSQHGFIAFGECANCHFASVGLRTCTAP